MPTHIILSNVNSLAANLHRDVHAVVDEQRHAVVPRERVQAASRFHHGRLLALLVAVLHARHAALERRLDDRDEVLGAEDRGRRVGDEVHAVVGRRCAFWCKSRHGGVGGAVSEEV